jgi:hypothetical protein
MEVVKFVPMRDSPTASEEGHTLIIAYLQDIGNLGIYLRGEQDHTMIEKFKVRLSQEGTFKVLDAPDNYKRRYAIRGVVGSKGEDDIELKHMMSVPLNEHSE